MCRLARALPCMTRYIHVIATCGHRALGAVLDLTLLKSSLLRPRAGTSPPSGSSPRVLI
jgi:hypothetical protein